MAQPNLSAPEFHPKNENPRARQQKPIPKTKAGLVPSDERVEVICIVECKPWAYVYEKDDEGMDVRRLRPLAKKERVLIDSDVAAVLEGNEHAVRV